MESTWNSLVQFFDHYVLPFGNILVPFLVLVVGWLIALIVAGIIRRVLARTEMDNRLVRMILGEETAAKIEPEKWISKGFYYLIMLFVLVAFFQVVGLTLVTEPLNQLLVQIFTFVPYLLSAGLLLLLAWILARLLRAGVVRVLTAAKVDERLGEPAGVEEPQRLSIPQSVGNAVYWLVFLLFLPTILDALGLEGLLQPVREMLGEAMGFLPNLFGAALILLVGWFAARIVQRIIANLLAATSLDRAGQQAGLDSVLGAQTLSGLVGLVAYSLIIILTVIAALDALDFEAISGPASQMLTTIFGAVPAIFTAALTLLVAYLVGRFVASLLGDLLHRMGFDGLIAKLGIGREKEGEEGQKTPAQVVGYLALVGIMLFAAVQAAEVLGFAGIASLLVKITLFAGKVLLGLFIFGVGLYLANLAAEIVAQKSSLMKGLLSGGVRVAILILAAAMALKEMGIADEIINTAFGLLLGAIALAVALAFGLGGREIAAREVERWLKSVRGQEGNE